MWTPVPVGRAEEKGLTGTAPRSSCSLRRAPAFSDLFESAGSPERRTWVRVVVGVGRRTEEVVEDDLSGREGGDLGGDRRGLGLSGFRSRFEQREEVRSEGVVQSNLPLPPSPQEQWGREW